MNPEQIEAAIAAADKLQRRLVEARMVWFGPMGKDKIHDARVILEGLGASLGMKVENPHTTADAA